MAEVSPEQSHRTKAASSGYQDVIMSERSLKQRFSTWLPSEKELQQHYCLRYLAKLIRSPRLWHYNRKSIAIACFIGLFVAMIPLPMQMLIAACWAIAFQANLPMSVSLVWISNPITIPPLFYLAYQLGAQILQIETADIASVELSWAQLSWESISSNFFSIWAPLLTGSLLIGAALGLSGFYLVNWLWRRDVMYRWQLRKQRK